MIDTITIKKTIPESLFYILKELKFGRYYYNDKRNKERYIPSLLESIQNKASRENKEDEFLGFQKIVINDKGKNSNNSYVRQNAFSISITINLTNILKEDYEGEKIDRITILKPKEIKRYSKQIQENIELKLKGYCFRFYFTDKADLMNQALNYSSFYSSMDIITDLNGYKIDRVDYCFQIPTPDAAEYIKLLKAGDKPNTGNPNLNDFKKEGSLYLISNQYNINFYNKQNQLSKKSFLPDAVLSEAENIVRIEVQYHRDKIRERVKVNSFITELEQVLSERNLEQAKTEVLSIYDNVAHQGDYYKKQELKQIINTKINSEPTRKKMFELIELVNTHPKKRPIRKVRELLKEGKLNSTLFKTQKDITSLIKKKFDRNNINVVCLEDSYERKCLLNLRRDILRELYK